MDRTLGGFLGGDNRKRRQTRKKKRNRKEMVMGLVNIPRIIWPEKRERQGGGTGGVEMVAYPIWINLKINTQRGKRDQTETPTVVEQTTIGVTRGAQNTPG